MSPSEREKEAKRERDKERERAREHYMLIASLVSSPEKNVFLTAADVLTSNPLRCKIMQIVNS